MMARAVDDVRIREVGSFAEYKRCEDLQRDVWSFPDVELVPAAHLIAIHHYGGTCIGAFVGDEMVGFVFGFPGWERGHAFHHSHMLAVLPEHRGRGLGESLKWAQRERVLAQGLDLVNWTFDPLQAPNANLNIQRLGAVARTYIVNLYGESWSPLHGGIPTDRLEAEWRLESERVRAARRGERPERPGWEGLPAANAVRTGSHGFLCCEDRIDLDLESPELLIVIPPRILPLMSQDRELALDWRLKTRRLFQTYFDRGYTAVGLHRGEDRAFYRLASRPPL